MSVKLDRGWRRSIIGLGVCAMVVTTLVDCSSGRREAERRAEEQRVDALGAAKSRFGAIARRFAKTLAAQQASPGAFVAADVDMGVRADSPVSVSDTHSAVAVSFRLLGAGSDELVAVSGASELPTYIARGPLGSEMIQRVSPTGVEDFFFFESAPAERELRYELDVSQVAGLRLVSNTLELLDQGGAPRLRVNPPYIVDAAGLEHAAWLRLTDCAFDDDASAPWGRPVVAPGQGHCTLSVSWRAGLAYPALLDPVWEDTSNSMVNARQGHTATKLRPGADDSIVLLAGGFEAGTGLSLCELYHPLSRTFSQTGSLAQARGAHVASSLRATATAPEGEPLVVVGGRATTAANNLTSDVLEVYNPGTGLWATSSASATARRNHTATLFVDDKILIVGGEDNADPVNTAEIYEFTDFSGDGATANGTISAVAGAQPTMTTTRAYHTATLLGTGGNVLIAGGLSVSNISVSSAEIYDVTNDTFIDVPVSDPGSFQDFMGVPRMRHRASVVPQANPTEVVILITGGTNGTAESVFQDRISMFKLNGTDSGFLKQSSPSTTQVKRADHGAAVMPDGSVVISGGRSTTSTVESSAELLRYDAATETVASTSLDPMVAARYAHVAVTVSAGATETAGQGVLVAGGSDGSNELASAQVLVAVNGEGCAENADCESGICSDGICCNEDCTETCKSCDGALTGGTTGVCTSLPNTVELAPECVSVPHHTTVTNRCDGLGAVEVLFAQDCRPATCNSTRTGCSVSCSSNADCDDTGWCNLDGGGTGGGGTGGGGGAGGNGGSGATSGTGGAGGGSAGRCEERKDFGEACSADEECKDAVGFSDGKCVDGVCCDGECKGQCEACNVPGTVGECTLVGLDTPQPPVEGNDRVACNGAGTACAGVCDGTVATECTYNEGVEPVEPTCACTETGCAETHTICDDNGGINSAAEGTTVDCNGHLCRDDTSCADSCETNDDCIEDYICEESVCRQLQGPECDGAQTLYELGDGPDTDCAPFACPAGATACLTECTSVDDCAGDAVCSADGACVEQITGPDVASCSCRVPGAATPGDNTPARWGWLLLGAVLLPLRRRREVVRGSTALATQTRAWLASLLALALCLVSFNSHAQGEDEGEGEVPAETPEPDASPAPAPPPPKAAPPAEGDDEPAPISQETKDKAKFHFRKGLKLLNEEAWAPALAEFLRSRELYATRVATNNAAVALRKLQRYDEALDMYETLLRDFKVKADQRAAAQKEIAELRSLVGTLDIVGAEPGANIVISSVDRGEYPPVSPIRVPAGKHVIRIYKQGFEPYQTAVDVAGGQIVSIDAKMAKLTASGRLRVKERSGRIVNVLVDNVVVGKTPWEGLLGVGDHTVTLRGAGKVGSQPATATVKSEELTTLALLAEDLNSQLRIDPTPAGAVVAIDGVDVGSGVWLGRLKSGPHKIEVRMDGFLSLEQNVTLRTGQREALTLELERDEDAPMWRKPSRWMFDATAGLVVMPTLGGDLADSCDGDCKAGIGLGALALVHAGYELGSGLGFGIELGYVLTSQAYTKRAAPLTPRGLSESQTGTVTDDLRMQGFMAGAALGYHFGEEYPVLLRLGAGVMVGEVRDSRTGDYVDRAGNAYSTFGVADFPGATYFYLDPGLKAGVAFGDHWELTGSVQALMLIALSQPKFNPNIEVAANTDGVANYDEEAVMGSFVIGVVPGANLRYHFE